MSFKFERLDVWNKALNLSYEIHELTKCFPREEKFILTFQIKRAADSVVLNIAEGSTGQTNAEFKQFLGYAIRSDVELVACLYLARKRDLIIDDRFEKLYDQSKDIVKMLQALRNSIT